MKIISYVFICNDKGLALLLTFENILDTVYKNLFQYPCDI